MLEAVVKSAGLPQSLSESVLVGKQAIRLPG